MNNQDAIKILDSERKEYIVKGCKLDKAIGMATEALKSERPKGKWLNKDYKSQCNCCRRIYPWQKYDRIYEANFCLECGADMRGEKREE